MGREEVQIEKKCDPGHWLVKVWLTSVDRKWASGRVGFLKNDLDREKEGWWREKAQGDAWLRV